MYRLRPVGVYVQTRTSWGICMSVHSRSEQVVLQKQEVDQYTSYVCRYILDQSKYTYRNRKQINIHKQEVHSQKQEVL
jgi:hypothetical protein